MKLTQRQKNIVRRMWNGESYYSLGSPYMSQKEADDFMEMGFWIQSGSCSGADTSDGRYYEFMKMDEKFVLIAEENGISLAGKWNERKK